MDVEQEEGSYPYLLLIGDFHILDIEQANNLQSYHVRMLIHIDIAIAEDTSHGFNVVIACCIV